MFFRIDRIGEPVADSGAYAVELGGVLKLNAPDARWEVANEYVCGRLAGLLGLPVPPGAIVQTSRGLGYASLRFGDRKALPPPLMNESALVADHPEEVAGIVAFDIWVGNPDRNRGNVAYAPSAYPLAAFDHGDALLCDQHRPPIEARLMSVPGSFLARALKTAGDFETWLRRIRHVDRGQLRAVLGTAVDAGSLCRADADRALAFLLRRQQDIGDLLKKSADLAHLVDWPLISS